jgi:hypothetical protein
MAELFDIDVDWVWSSICVCDLLLLSEKGEGQVIDWHSYGRLAGG